MVNMISIIFRYIISFILIVSASQAWTIGNGINGTYGYDSNVVEQSILLNQQKYTYDTSRILLIDTKTPLSRFSGKTILAGAFFAFVDIFSVAKGVSNPVPGTVARVVPDTPITRASGTLGRPGADDVFVTGANDIRGLNAKQIAERLTIPESPTGFRVIEFPTPKSGIASPVNRTDPGFIGRGRTAGGAREFVIPNGSIPSVSSTRVVR